MLRTPEARAEGDLAAWMAQPMRFGVAPDNLELIDRKKQGFGVPVYEWFFERLGQFARPQLSDFCEETDFLNRAEVMKVLDRRDASRAWNLLNLALWWKQYIGCKNEEMAHSAD